MYLINLMRAWIADSLIQLGYSIAPDHYLEGMLAPKQKE